ncbi:MAG: aminotransferase class I/II-fold pyridoxal phosphate-dependent enzyme [Candidatus Aminicenantes bacterium]|nr:aminotransferase class I/II-fold pyridoxal phosphate-dependent enzyme [Candidatus Aminicenantes bacterium]
MKIETFKMERMQSAWENVVDYNLSESGVHPLSLRELVSDDALEEILRLELGYTQTNGTLPLRRNIARLYPGADTEQILVTAGSSESNFLLMWRSLDAGDEVLFELPNYMQMWGLQRGFRAKPKCFWLREENGWALDLDALRKLVTRKTRMIVLTNPNNPTGAILTPAEMDAVVDLADRCGAWIVSDEVYQGAERDGRPTPSFWGRYDKTVVVNGLSKAYGLPGLRVGWMVGPRDVIQGVWPYHDYTTISLSALSDKLASIVLEPDKREKILGRTRSILQRNYPLLESWLAGHGALFRFVPPRAGAIAFVRYDLKITSVALVEKLIREQSVLLVPGDHFEMDGHLRFGFGSEESRLRYALARVDKVLAEVS